MTFTDITQIIANLGFPIAACIALYIMNTKTINKLTEAVEEFVTTANAAAAAN